MERLEPLRWMILRSSLIFLALVLSGCVTQSTEPPPSVAAVPGPAPEPAATPIPQPVSPRIAIVLSESLPAYIKVSEQLIAYLHDYEVYDLDAGRSPRETFTAIEESNAKLVIAIGLHAAKAAKSFAGVPVVFSQVFNVNDSDLISGQTKGVAVLPPLELQAEAWRGLDPNLRDVGAILGAGHEDLIVEAERAMRKYGIRFHCAVAKSDRETLYLFNRMTSDIDGFLLFPDNRILSATVLTEILNDAARHRVQVAVFSESLLEHGATFSANSVATDIADKIVIAVNEIFDGNVDSVAALTPLSEIRIVTNPALVQKFGLDVSRVKMGPSVGDAR